MDFLVFASGIEPFRRSNALTCEGWGETNLRCLGVARQERVESRVGKSNESEVCRGDVGAEPAASRTRTDGCQGARGSGSPVNTTASDGPRAAMGWKPRGRVLKRHLDVLCLHLLFFSPPLLIAGTWTCPTLPTPSALPHHHKLSDRLMRRVGVRKPDSRNDKGKHIYSHGAISG